MKERRFCSLNDASQHSPSLGPDTNFAFASQARVKRADVHDSLSYPSSAPVLPSLHQNLPANHTPTCPFLLYFLHRQPKGMKPTTSLRRRPLLLLLVVLQRSFVLTAAQQGGLRSHWAVPTVTDPHAPLRPGVADCDELYFEQPIDHFSYHAESKLDGLTFQQRYFVCGKQWWGGPDAPIFFYT